jgi:hypothetical protein
MMIDKVIYTTFLSISALVGAFMAASPHGVARILGASEKRRASMNLVLWRILGSVVSIGCVVKLVGIWIFAWKD